MTAGIELDAWGGEEPARSWNSQQQPRKFTSYDRDGNGNDQAMFCNYHGSQLRFDQPDPYDGSYSLTDPQSFNRYSYVQNDPVNFVDPSGLLTCMIDGIESSCGMAFGLLNSGAGVLGPANTTHYNSERGTFEFFYAYANGSGWLPQNARYIGGLNWGWTDYSRDAYPGYTYTLSENRLNGLVWSDYYGFGWSSGRIFRDVYGGLHEGGIDMYPAVDPVTLAAGALAGGVLGGLRSVAGSAAENVLANVSKGNLKHIAQHLPKFQQLNPTMTLEDVVRLGQQIASRPGNLIGTPGGRQVFQETVSIGRQQATVRAVLNPAGGLRSVHIRQ